MTPGFSIPTDNIYKFYALLGLALVISSMLAFVYVYDSHRAQVIEWSEEIRQLSYKKSHTEGESERIDNLQHLIDVEGSNKEFYMTVIGAVGGSGISIGIIGLVVWQFRVQPRSDRLLDLQIKSLELE